MHTLMIILSILFAIDCLCLTAIVLLQQGKTAGLSGAIERCCGDIFRQE